MAKNTRQDKRINTFAQMMADGMSPADIGRALELSKGQTANTLRRIKCDLGEQAV